MDGLVYKNRDDAIFFMGMVNSAKSPNHVPGFYKSKPYYKILDNRESAQFQRFMKIYIAQKYVLTVRERQILNDLYGFDKPRLTLKNVGILHNITQERVRQIRQYAERKIVNELMEQSGSS